MGGDSNTSSAMEKSSSWASTFGRESVQKIKFLKREARAVRTPAGQTYEPIKDPDCGSGPRMAAAGAEPGPLGALLSYLDPQILQEVG